MMKALVLYHSLFGNTKTVAHTLAEGIQEAGIDVVCMSISEVDLSTVVDYNLIAIGSPTHMIRPSKEMKEFLDKLKTLELKGRFGFAFDTRNESRMNKRSLFVLENSAARSIEGVMKRKKMKIIRPRASAIVHGREGPLETGVEEEALRIGREIGNLLVE
jgi:flavodoxin